MTNLIIIPARKNSRRLKNKNLSRLGKKNLVERAIDFALKIEKKNNIYLSTDSQKIKNIGLKYGIFCPSLRPKNFSASNTSSEDTCVHAIKTYERINKLKIDTVILLQPTSPFRSTTIFNKTLRIYKKNNLATVTVSEIGHKTLKNKIIFKNQNELTIIKKISEHYYTNGNLYIISKKHLMKKKTFLPNKFNISLIKSHKYSMDIDTIYDLKKAKFFLNK